MATPKIILADDHPVFRSGLRSLIEKEKDLKVIGEAKDGEDLLEKLSGLKPDLVVLDLSMPNLDGIGAISELKEKYPKLKILVLTMQKDHEHFKEAMKRGANGFVLKEDAYEELIRAVKAVLQDKFYISAKVEKVLAERTLRSITDTEFPSSEILTKREQEILKGIAQGLPNKAIAAKLKISIRTVETHRMHLTDKLGIKTAAGLVKYAISKGLI